MQNNAFYKGMLFELEKIANPDVVTTPSGTNYTPNSKPSSPVHVNNTPLSTDTFHRFAGGVAGSSVGMAEHIPMVGKWLNNKVNSNINNNLSNVGVTSSTPESGNTLSPFQQGFLQSNDNALNYLNSDKTGLPSKTFGIASYNANTNSVEKDFSKIPGFLSSHIGPWLQNNWGKLALGVGGSVALLGILSHLLSSHKEQNSMPQLREAEGRRFL